MLRKNLGWKCPETCLGTEMNNGDFAVAEFNTDGTVWRGHVDDLFCFY